MDRDVRSKLIGALVEGPQVALFGQRGLGIGSDDDPLLAAFATEHDGADLYDWWLTGTVEPEDRIAALQQSTRICVVPEGRQRVLHWPWTIVFSSAIDDALSRALEIPNRRLVNQIVGTDFTANVPSTPLRLVRLFGTVERATVDERPPQDRRDLAMRRSIAQTLLRRIPSLVASRGTLFVDGWNPVMDWLRPRDLAGAISSLDRGQVFVCGVDGASAEALRGDEDFSILIDAGVVTVLDAGLARTFADLHDTGELPCRADDSATPADHVIYEVLRDRSPRQSGEKLAKQHIGRVTFDSLEWRKLAEGLLPIQSIEPSVRLPADPHVQYREFRHFAAHGPTKQNLQWVRELAFRRAAVDELLERCRRVAGARAPQETLLVLRGQTGSGKSVALAQLAIDLREHGLPVLYVPPTILRIDRKRVDTFCDRVAESSQAPVFLIYDGAQAVEEYFELAEHFASAARKCVVVGSAFTFEGEDEGGAIGRRHPHHGYAGLTEERVLISVRLDEEEQQRLLAHLDRFIEPGSINMSALLRTGTDHFFAAIYRAMPDSRGRLEEGFLRECIEGSRRMEQRLEHMLSEERSESRWTTSALADALRVALGDKLEELISGNTTGTSAMTPGTSDRARGISAKSRNLLDAVMLVSRYQLQLPQSIGLRMLHYDIRAYRGTFTAGLLDEREIGRDVYALAARHPIEADIWVRQHMLRSDDQWNVIEQIAANVEGRELQDDYSIELEFLLSLLRTLGPKGPRHVRREADYPRIAGLIKGLRDRHGELSARILLIESNAVREWVRWHQRRHRDDIGATELPLLIEQLDNAERGLRDAYGQVYARAGESPPPPTRRLLATLETERACVIGTKIGSLVRYEGLQARLRPAAQAQANSWWRAATDALQNSLRWNDSSREAIDATCWICREREDVGFTDDLTRADVLEAWAQAIDRYSELELSIDQESRRDDSVAKFREALGDWDAAKAIWIKLRDAGTPAARALYARHLADRESPQAALDYLKASAGSTVTAESRLLYPYLRLWWRVNTGHDTFFPGERQALSFTRGQWEELRHTCRAWRAFEPENGVAMYLEATADLHLGDAGASARMLRTLARLDTGGSLRSKSLMLFADESGVPVKLSAVYKGDGRGRSSLAWCDRLRQNVEFFPREFEISEPRPGTHIEPFHLAITFRGLRAEATHRYAPRQRI